MQSFDNQMQSFQTVQNLVGRIKIFTVSDNQSKSQKFKKLMILFPAFFKFIMQIFVCQDI